MKILHIIDHLGLGGAQTVVKGIFESQQSNRDIFLFSLRRRSITNEINHKNIKIFDSVSKYSLKPIESLIRLIQDENIQIIHCHLFRAQYMGYLLKKKFPNLKLIFHEHGEIFENHITYNFFMRFSQNIVDRIIAVSNSTKDKLIEKSKIKKNKIVLLSNFVDLDKFRPNKKAHKKFTLGFVGRLSKIKGCQILLESLPYLNFDYDLLIAGDGPEIQKLKEIRDKLNLESKVKFLGYVRDSSEVYSKIDVCVVPSLNESFGISAIESQAMSVPVIASNIDGLKEVVINGETGLFFEKNNKKDLAKKLNFIYSNKKIIKKMMLLCLKNVKKYSLKNYLTSLSKIYHEL